MEETQRMELLTQIADVFSPSAPVDQASLFAGRAEEIQMVLDTVKQRGQHAIIFGERGVGKTSLANVLPERIHEAGFEGVITGKINCDGEDNFSSLWLKILREFSVARRTRPMGFVPDAPPFEVSTLNQLIGSQTVTPDDVRFMLQRFVRQAVVIIDEVDRLTDKKTTRLLADTIKSLSDNSIDTTLILLGVADSVDDLIAEHASIERCLVQVQMPRMSTSELFEIIDKGLSKLQMTIDDQAKNHIARLSQGLPHYTHLLALYATQEAIENDRLNIEMKDVSKAIDEAVKKTQHSILTAYNKAINGTYGTIYDEVLLACALAGADDLGYFAPSDVLTPLSVILEKPVTLKSFSRHLSEFCEEKRGFSLQESDVTRRFRFTNPLMQPFVIIYGLSKGLIDEAKLGRIMFPAH